MKNGLLSMTWGETANGNSRLTTPATKFWRGSGTLDTSGGKHITCISCIGPLILFSLVYLPLAVAVRCLPGFHMTSLQPCNQQPAAISHVFSPGCSYVHPTVHRPAGVRANYFAFYNI